VNTVTKCWKCLHSLSNCQLLMKALCRAVSGSAPVMQLPAHQPPCTPARPCRSAHRCGRHVTCRDARLPVTSVSQVKRRRQCGAVDASGDGEGRRPALRPPVRRQSANSCQCSDSRPIALCCVSHTTGAWVPRFLNTAMFNFHTSFPQFVIYCPLRKVSVR
jgi:hypothetical protein